ncbi:sugar diacid recognition domain-containing protein [Marinobacter sp. X15-166B]|uniref:sugar diacid recognition domain-containing protein n=1 Tax=Marinobacter sp. X15-166B TaxID=1897620 RepID=UPI00085C98D5|nr:sugar diacid recognition domain-containing protein [Marinobacter sp. X15-166B]OEY66989.1 hypothetical protein BG841_11340 [Marinobacter sp. X15-166B]
MMTLDHTTAQRIVDRAMQVIGHSVNVMTPNGVIIASGDRLRVGEVHQGARQVALQGEPLTVDVDNAHQFPGVRPGVNLPIMVSKQVVAVVGISGEPDKVLRFADLVKVTAELMLEQSALLELGQQRRRQVEETLLALISGRAVPQVWLDQLRLDMDQPRVALIVEPARPPGSADFVITLMRLLEHSDRGLLLAQTAPQRLLVLVPVRLPGTSDPGSVTAQALARIQRLLPATTLPTLAIAAGQYVAGNLRAGYESACATMTTGRHNAPHQRVYRYSDHPVATLWQSLQPGWQQQALQEPLLALHEHPRAQLYIRTLQSFISSNGDIQQCAATLHLHRNTIRYRLKNIEQLTGLSPFRLADLLRLQLALHSGDISPAQPFVQAHKP